MDVIDTLITETLLLINFHNKIPIYKDFAVGSNTINVGLTRKEVNGQEYLALVIVKFEATARDFIKYLDWAERVVGRCFGMIQISYVLGSRIQSVLEARDYEQYEDGYRKTALTRDDTSYV